MQRASWLMALIALSGAFVAWRFLPARASSAGAAVVVEGEPEVEVAA
jgi:hypothetical protein